MRILRILSEPSMNINSFVALTHLIEILIWCLSPQMLTSVRCSRVFVLMEIAGTPLAVSSVAATAASLWPQKRGTAQVWETGRIKHFVHFITGSKQLVSVPFKFSVSQTSMSVASPRTCAVMAPVSIHRAALSVNVSRATRAASWWWRTAWVSPKQIQTPLQSFKRYAHVKSKSSF